MKTAEEREKALIVPVKKEIEVIRNKKVVYFGDPMLTTRCDSIEQECEEVIIPALEFEDIRFEKIKCMDMPPFGQVSYDILFFDYGGMSIGNDLLGSFCRHILREAQDYPSRYYVMVSSFTQYAMKDALSGFASESGIRHLSNIYLSIQDFARAFKKYEL